MAGFGVWLRGLLGKEEPASGPSLPHARARQSGPQSFAEDNNDFALAMYGTLRQRPGNLFFSPFGIRTALGRMARRSSLDSSCLIARHGRGTMNLVDFRHGAEASRVTMNQWVEDLTRRKIRELIPPGSLDAERPLSR